MCILTNKAIKVKFVGEEKYGFVKGKIYQAYEIKSAFPNKHEMISVVDDFGEEYAYPREWFEIVQ